MAENADQSVSLGLVLGIIIILLLGFFLFWNQFGGSPNPQVNSDKIELEGELNTDGQEAKGQNNGGQTNNQ